MVVLHRVKLVWLAFRLILHLFWARIHLALAFSPLSSFALRKVALRFVSLRILGFIFHGFQTALRKMLVLNPITKFGVYFIGIYIKIGG